MKEIYLIGFVVTLLVSFVTAKSTVMKKEKYQDKSIEVTGACFLIAIFWFVAVPVFIGMAYLDSGKAG